MPSLKFLRFFILLTSSILINPVAYSQVTVSHAKQGIPGQQEGFFYALPQTVLKVDFIVKKNNPYRRSLQ